jgi:hypothetical protein
MIDWCLAPTLAVFRLYRSVEMLNNKSNLYSCLLKGIHIFECSHTSALKRHILFKQWS